MKKHYPQKSTLLPADEYRLDVCVTRFYHAGYCAVAIPDLSRAWAKPKGFYVTVFPIKAIFHMIRHKPKDCIMLSRYHTDWGRILRELQVEYAVLGQHQTMHPKADTDVIALSHGNLSAYVVIFVSQRSLQYLHYDGCRRIKGFHLRFYRALNRLRQGIHLQ